MRGGGRALGCRWSPPVCEWGDNQPRRVAQVLIGVFDLGITDVGEAVLLFFVPAVSKLRLPGEGLRTLYLQQEPESLSSRPVPGALPSVLFMTLITPDRSYRQERPGLEADPGSKELAEFKP